MAGIKKLVVRNIIVDKRALKAQNFVQSHYEGSLLNLVNAMYQGKSLDEQGLDELQEWLAERSKRDD